MIYVELVGQDYVSIFYQCYEANASLKTTYQGVSEERLKLTCGERKKYSKDLSHFRHVGLKTRLHWQTKPFA